MAFNYTDSVMFGNIAELINKDMRQTMNNYSEHKNGTRIEENPILRGRTGDKNFVGGYGLLATGLLGNRWKNMDSDSQRRMEMLIAQAVQAYALNRSGEPWKVQYGFQF